LLNDEDAEQIAALRSLLRQVVSNLQTTLKLGATVGLSKRYPSLISDCKAAYDNAKTALRYKYYTGANQLICMDDLETDQGLTNAHTKDHALLREEELLMSLRVCNETGLEAWLSSFLAFLKNETLSQHETKTISLQQMIAATHVLVEMHPQLQLDELLSAQDMERIFRAGTLDDLSDLLRAFMLGLLAKTQSLRKSGKNAVIEKTKAYIQEHYALNLTLETIAAEVYLSPVYLSFLFKQVEAMNITDYITQVRIDRAKGLLHGTHLKTSEIAGLVGYQDDKYFTRIFKKRVGMTPTEYRAQA
jgi:two-component system response regulator YesN